MRTFSNRTSAQRLWVCALLATGAVAARSAVAAPVRASFDGTVNSIFYPYANAFSSLGVGVGSAMHGSLTFDDGVPDSLPSDPTLGSYADPVRSFELVVAGGAWTLSSVGLSSCCMSQITVTNQAAADEWQANLDEPISDSPTIVGPVEPFLVFLSDTGTALANDGIVPPASGWTELDAELYGINFRISSIIVPEARLASSVTAIVGLLALCRSIAALRDGPARVRLSATSTQKCVGKDELSRHAAHRATSRDRKS